MSGSGVRLGLSFSRDGGRVSPSWVVGFTMTGYPVLAAGRTRILLVAAFFYAFSILSILLFAATLALPNTKAHVPLLFRGLAMGAAAFYLLKGSTFAKWFLLAMSVISVLTAVPVLWLGNNQLTRPLGVFFGIGGVTACTC
jgi:hypothetical protein